MKIKKKILIFSTAYHPFVGGAEVAIKEITNRLGDDFEFDMVTTFLNNNLPRVEKIGNINVYRVGFSLGIQKRVPRQLTNLFYICFGFWKAILLNKKNRYDATWSMMAAYAGAIGLFFKIVNPKIPFLLTLQEGDDILYIKSRVGWYREHIWKLLFKKADRIQVISNFLADWAKENGAIAPVVVVPNGVDTKIFVKKDLEINSKEKILITTSRLVEKNAIDDIIKSLNFLREDVKLFILGDGPQREELKNLVEKLNLKKRVRFLGSVSQSEIPEYFKMSSIFIRPSLSEGFGNSFIEAMAAEIPVIATPVGGILDFLKDGETGLFCNIRDPKSIAEKVSTLLKDEGLRNKITQNAKKMVVEKYDWKIIAKDMREKVFNNLVGNPVSN